MAIAVQCAYAFHNELHPVDLEETTSEIQNNRNEETYMDFFKRALKIALTQITCNAASYLHDDEQNLSNTPLNAIEIACEGVEGPAIKNEPPKIAVERPIIRVVPEPQPHFQPSYKPMTFEQKAIFNSYLQRQKLQLDCDAASETLAFAP